MAKRAARVAPPRRRADAKMVLDLACGHTLHLWPRTNAEHLYNRANTQPGHRHSALCAECEVLQRVVGAREEKVLQA